MDEPEEERENDFITGAMGGMACLMLLTQVLGLFTLPIYQSQDIKAVEDPSDPINIATFLLFILLFTGVILFLSKIGKRKVIKGLILFVVMYSSVYVIQPILGGVGVPEMISFGAALLIGVGLTAALLFHPEWYVVDATGVIIGAGIIGILGRSFDIPIAVGFLVALAVYDAFSVYKTKHMVALADSVLELHLPVLFVVPKKRGYTFLDQKGNIQEGRTRDALFMGLGDAIIPGILSASSANFLPGANAFYVGLCVIGGILGGYAALMYFVRKGNPQAGLPLLNTGAILGFLLGYGFFFYV